MTLRVQATSCRAYGRLVFTLADRRTDWEYTSQGSSWRNKLPFLHHVCPLRIFDLNFSYSEWPMGILLVYHGCTKANAEYCEMRLGWDRGGLLRIHGKMRESQKEDCEINVILTIMREFKSAIIYSLGSKERLAWLCKIRSMVCDWLIFPCPTYSYRNG